MIFGVAMGRVTGSVVSDFGIGVMSLEGGGSGVDSAFGGAIAGLGTSGADRAARGRGGGGAFLGGKGFSAGAAFSAGATRAVLRGSGGDVFTGAARGVQS